MSQQTELTCVSCDTAFDPAPTGGFCPECDTPHPDFEHAAPEETGEDEPSDTGSASAESIAADAAEAESADQSTADASGTDATPTAGATPSYCPSCGESLADATAPADGAADAWDCPDCGRAVTDESYCPDCGTDLEAARADEQAAVDDDDADVAVDEAETEIPAAADDEPAATPSEITLVVNGEPYTFGDGDTFGRDDEDWLEDLVVAAGGSDALSYISGEHVEFSIENDGVYVTDVSRNGTLLNTRELDGGRAKVEDGDFLTLAGRAEVQVKF